jgi:murein DD-endopeptidase MepM/ murein hydrolase activator NlpD
MPEWSKEMLRWAEILSPVFLIVSLVAPVGFYARRRRWALWGFGLIATQAIANAVGSMLLAGGMGLAIVFCSLLVLTRGIRDARRIRAAWVKRFMGEPPIRLEPPFEGRWKGLNTGPWAARNHHLAARDQWFAVDWVRADRPSRGSRILAPSDGVVAYVEDGHLDKRPRRWIQRDPAQPAGNYVSLRVAGRAEVYLILAHIEQGSIAVREGQTVRAGDLLGLCGNSGNTSMPHLHIHAQRGERFAPGASWGVPLVFGTATVWARPGDVIDGVA